MHAHTRNLRQLMNVRENFKANAGIVIVFGTLKLKLIASDGADINQLTLAVRNRRCCRVSSTVYWGSGIEWPPLLWKDIFGSLTAHTVHVHLPSALCELMWSVWRWPTKAVSPARIIKKIQTRSGRRRTAVLLLKCRRLRGVTITIKSTIITTTTTTATNTTMSVV